MTNDDDLGRLEAEEASSLANHEPEAPAPDEDEPSPTTMSDEDLEIVQLGRELASIANREEADTEMGNDQPFCVLHHRHYHEGGIIDSVPLTFDRENWGGLRRLESRYVLMNYALEQARAWGRTDYHFLTLIAPLLSRTDKKAVHNRMRSTRDGLIAVKMAILSLTKVPQTQRHPARATVELAQCGFVCVDDCNDIPSNLKTGYVYRFRSTTGKRFFRLGWTARDEERGHYARANEDTPRQPEAG